jgi:predicted Zn-dependent protease
VPNWLSTHPASETRVEEATPLAAKFVSAEAKTINKDQYLEHINGLVFGDKPEDGVVRGNEFLHPLLRIGVTFPDGWEITNSEQAVMAREPGTDHYMVLQEVDRQSLLRTGGQASNALAETAIAVMRQAGYQNVDGSLQSINGNPAYVGVYRGTAKDVGKVTMHAAHVSIGRQLYVIAGFAPEKEFEFADQQIAPALQTFRQLSAREAADIRPNKIQFYVVKPGDSWQSIAVRQSRGFINASTLAIINDHDVSAQPRPGDRIKIIVEG